MQLLIFSFWLISLKFSKDHNGFFRAEWMYNPVTVLQNPSEKFQFVKQKNKEEKSNSCSKRVLMPRQTLFLKYYVSQNIIFIIWLFFIIIICYLNIFFLFSGNNELQTSIQFSSKSDSR